MIERAATRGLVAQQMRSPVQQPGFSFLPLAPAIPIRNAQAAPKSRNQAKAAPGSTA
jgi:hypothetical protein